MSELSKEGSVGSAVPNSVITGSVKSNKGMEIRKVINKCNTSSNQSVLVIPGTRTYSIRNVVEDILDEKISLVPARQ